VSPRWPAGQSCRDAVERPEAGRARWHERFVAHRPAYTARTISRSSKGYATVPRTWYVS
jgi:hypothetical protein